MFCVGLYLAMRLTGGADNAALLAFGAKTNGLIRAGEWWRFVTPIFLHVPMGTLPIHLLVNMYSLWNIGPYVEKLYGSSKFVVIWVVTGIFGVVGSYLSVRPNLQVGTIGSFLIKSTDGPSAGASGALFGLVGVLLVFGIKYRRELPEGFKKAFGTGLLPVLLVNLGIGFVGRGIIDNAAHLGGLVSGMALALVVDYERPSASPMTKNLWRVMQGVALALVAVSFFFVWRHYSSPPKQETITSLMVAINKGQRAAADSLSKDSVAPLMEANKELAAIPSISPDTDTLVRELRSIVERAQAIPPPVDGKEDPPAVRAARIGLNADLEAWVQNRDRWLDGEGATFNLVRDSSDEPGPSPKQ